MNKDYLDKLIEFVGTLVLVVSYLIGAGLINVFVFNYTIARFYNVSHIDFFQSMSVIAYVAFVSFVVKILKDIYNKVGK